MTGTGAKPMDQHDLLDKYDAGLPAWTVFTSEEDGERRIVHTNSRFRVVEQQRNGLTLLRVTDFAATARHDWRDLQRLKNEICGEEAWAMELYPKESQLTDTENVYHLWVAPPETLMPSFAFQDRAVLETSNGNQRPWPEDLRPADCMTHNGGSALLETLARQKLEQEPKAT